MSVNLKYSKQDYIFDVFNSILMILFCISTLYPFIYLLSLSFSGASASFVEIRLIPEEIVLTNYGKVLASQYILSGFSNTILRTGLGTLLTLIVTVCAAYPLSKKYFPHRNFWTSFIVFTMFFSGGLIPNYLLVKNLNMIDQVWALVLPGLINTFIMIIARNYFSSLPDSLEESARIDGANDILILFKIILPISAPIIATLALWTAVGHWNAWFDSLIYIQNTKKQVLQVVLRRTLIEGTQQMMDLNSGVDDVSTVNPESIKAATVMVTTLPIILLYPFLQKYFVKGIMVGSLKG